MTIWKGSKIAGPLALGDDSQTRPTHHSVLGSGGHQEVPDIASRNAIPVDTFLHEDGNGSGRRRNMMLVSVGDDGTGNTEIYQLVITGFNALSDNAKLTALADNSNWVIFSTSVDYISTTYATLTTLKTGSSLVPGTWYKFTHQTKYKQLRTNIIQTGSNETIIIKANSTNTFEPVVSSVEFPHDYIEYNFDDNLCEDGTTPRTGFIHLRKDTIRNNQTPYDFRNIKFRRYAVDTDSISDWVTSHGYSVDDIVKTGNKIYKCITAHSSGTFSTDLRTGNWAFIIDYSSNVYYSTFIPGMFEAPWGMLGVTIPQINGTFQDLLTFDPTNTNIINVKIELNDKYAGGIKPRFYANTVFINGTYKNNYISADANEITFASDSSQCNLTGSITNIIVYNSNGVYSIIGNVLSDSVIYNISTATLEGACPTSSISGLYLKIYSCSNLTLLDSCNGCELSFCNSFTLGDTTKSKFNNLDTSSVTNAIATHTKLNFSNFQNKKFTTTLDDALIDITDSTTATYSGTYPSGIRITDKDTVNNVLWYNIRNEDGSLSFVEFN